MEVLGAIPESSFLGACPWIKVGGREHSLGSAVLSRFQNRMKHAGLVSFYFIIINFLNLLLKVVGSFTFIYKPGALCPCPVPHPPTSAELE